MAEASAETTGHKVDDPCVCDPASHIEILYGQLSDEEETQDATKLRASCVIGPVKVRAVDWASNNVLHVIAREPGSHLYQNKESSLEQ